jgi:5'-nucleotidase
MTDRPLIFITNDDGIHARGLHELVEVMQLFGDVVVIAPKLLCRGCRMPSRSDHPLRANKLSEERGITVYKCNGTPVDCVKLGFNHLLDKMPDFVVSGINHGANSSISVIIQWNHGGCYRRVPSRGAFHRVFTPRF